MKVCITGGGGYVGTQLTRQLIREGHEVTVLDLFWFGDFLTADERLTKISGDIRDEKKLKRAFEGQDAVIHLACVSNDPSFDLNPKLSTTINCDAFAGILREVKEAKVSRFIYASSSSVYGVSEEVTVGEDAAKNPLTDYSKFKLHCEEMLQKEGIGDGIWTIVRPATVCGFSPRMRFDVVVNQLTIQALEAKKIKVFGGKQMRSHLHIRDMVGLYTWLLEQPVEKINGQIFNASYENMSVEALAQTIKSLFAGGPDIEFQESNDNRSYHVDSKKLRDAGFIPKYSTINAIGDLCEAYDLRCFQTPLTNPRYYNIKQMQELNL